MTTALMATASSDLAVLISVDLIAAARKAENGFFSHLPHSAAVESAARYEKYLALIQRYPHAHVSPARDIDEMWHLHMLHPVAYYRDCMANFGEILDHDRGFGSEPAEVPILAATFAHTAALWEKEYSEPYAVVGSGSVKCTRNCVSRCKRACKTK